MILKEIREYLETGKIPSKPTDEEKIEMIKKHLDYLLESKPEKVAASEIRMHISNYLKGMPKNNEIKEKIFKTKDIKEIKEILDNYIKNK